jgi:putative NADH-flavin reductase
MERTMRITIFGATGGVGRQAVEQAVDAGHEVTVVVRDPSKLTRVVRVVQADLSSVDVNVIEGAVRGADGVLSCLGPRSKPEAKELIVTKSTSLIIRAMKETGTHRLIAISAAPVGTIPSPGRPNPPKSDPGDGFFVRNLLTPIVKAAFRDTYADLAEMEDAVRDSGLDWTLTRPPRLLNRKLTGQYRTSTERNLSGGRAISRADLAHYMIHALSDPESIHQFVRVAY